MTHCANGVICSTGRWQHMGDMRYETMIDHHQIRGVSNFTGTILAIPWGVGESPFPLDGDYCTLRLTASSLVYLEQTLNPQCYLHDLVVRPGYRVLKQQNDKAVSQDCLSITMNWRSVFVVRHRSTERGCKLPPPRNALGVGVPELELCPLPASQPLATSHGSLAASARAPSGFG